MFTVDEANIRAKLERALHQRMSLAEWKAIKESGLLDEFQRSELSWPDLRGVAKDMLGRLRRHVENVRREEAGELDEDADHEPLPELIAAVPAVVVHLDSRTTARSHALSALDQLHAREQPAGRARIHSTHMPRGGVDGTLPQWVIFMGVEAWVPADDVKESYRAHQQALLNERPPKTSARAFEVAEFVWEQERFNGKRPPWPVLCERWNNWPLTKPFRTWQHFRMTFLRGAKATPPRYFATKEQLTEQVRSGAHKGAFEKWAASFRE